MKNILVINSSLGKKQPFSDIFEELFVKGYSFYWFLPKGVFDCQKDIENIKKFGVKKVFLGPRPNTKFKSFLFFILLPGIFLAQFFNLWIIKRKKKIRAIICFNFSEKIIFTPLAKFFKLKILWIEYPDIIYSEKSRFLIIFFGICARWAKIIMFTSFSRMQIILVLKSKFKKEKIRLIPFGIKLNQPNHQDTIFSSIAKNNQANFQKKYFTVGAVTNFRQPNQIENLFNAIKKCLEIIPNLQLIIVGDDLELISKVGQSKNLNWLAKKMGIDNAVWFVGEQSHLKKWLDSFDIFVATCERARFFDLSTVLKAMNSGLPIIGFRNRGLDDIIDENNTGIMIDVGNSELLAQNIIRLYKDKGLRHKFSKNALQAIDNFTIGKLAVEFEKEIG